MENNLTMIIVAYNDLDTNKKEEITIENYNKKFKFLCGPDKDNPQQLEARFLIDDKTNLDGIQELRVLEEKLENSTIFDIKLVNTLGKSIKTSAPIHIEEAMSHFCIDKNSIKMPVTDYYTGDSFYSIIIRHKNYRDYYSSIA